MFLVVVVVAVVAIPSYLAPAKPLIHIVTSLGFAVSLREFANQNLCRT